MKKIILILTVLFTGFCFALEQDATVFFPSTSAVYESSSKENSLINVDNMKRADKVENAKKEAAAVEKRKIKLDGDEIMRERALDFTTKQNNALLPSF